MSQCDQILKNSIKDNCKEPLVEGLEKVGIIINKADIDLTATVYDATCPNLITDLTLKSGKSAYEIYQRNNAFTGTNSTAVVGTYRNSTTHLVNFVVFDNGPEVANSIIDPLFNGDFVIILENKYKKLTDTREGSSAFQVYGMHNGMRLNAAIQEKYSEETGSGWNITMEEVRAPKSAMFIWKEGYDETKALVQGMVKTV